MKAEYQRMKIHEIDLLEQRTNGGIAVFHEELYHPQGAVSRLLSENCIHVCRIVEGSGIHRVLDQEIPCRAGDIYIVPPNTPHGYFLSDGGEGMAVDLLLFSPSDWFSEEPAALGNARYCYGVFSDSAAVAYVLLNEQQRREVDGLLASMESELTERRQEWREAVRTYLIQLLISVGRYINCAIKNDTPVSSKDWNLVLSVMRMAKEHYKDCNFTLESVSDALFISKSHLSHIFKGLTGQMFSEYLRDVRIENACRLLRETNMKVDEVVEHCGLRDIPSFYHNFSAQMRMTPRQYRQLASEKKEKNSLINQGEIIMSILTEISENLQKGKAKIVKELVQKALDEGANPEQILNEGLLAGMSVVGEKFKNNEVYVPEVLVAARAMNMGAQILKPVLAEAGVQATGKVCIGTVQGDLHDIGKNLVKMMMEGKGLEVVDLGTDVAPETFVQTAIEQNCQVICCSALLTTTMNVMEDVVKAARVAGVRDKVKIMIGGAPVNQEFCDKIGADCYTVDAASAADAAAAFCKA